MRDYRYSHTIDKGSWPRGPWDDEPDDACWIDEGSGYRCAIRRHPVLGHLCGYVALPPEHPWHGCSSSTYDVGQPHGGITYEHSAEVFLADSAYDGWPSDLWVVGFDCGHSRDAQPGFPVLGVRTPLRDAAVYRDWSYVLDEVAEFATAFSLAYTPPVPKAHTPVYVGQRMRRVRKEVQHECDSNTRLRKRVVRTTPR